MESKRNDWLFCETHERFIEVYQGIKSVERAQKKGHAKCSLSMRNHA